MDFVPFDYPADILGRHIVTMEGKIVKVHQGRGKVVGRGAQGLHQCCDILHSAFRGSNGGTCISKIKGHDQFDGITKKLCRLVEKAKGLLRRGRGQ